MNETLENVHYEILSSVVESIRKHINTLKDDEEKKEMEVDIIFNISFVLICGIGKSLPKEERESFIENFVKKFLSELSREILN